MSNHESFLKMIGLEKEFDPPKDESSQKSDSKRESSWTALIPGSEEHQKKEESFSGEPALSTDEEFAAPPEEPALVAEDDWGIPESSASATTEPAADVEPVSDVEPASDVESRTEVYGPEETPTESLTEPEPESTAVYSQIEKSRVSDNRTLTQTASKAMTLSQALSGTATRTRKTVPFEYDEAQQSQDAGTAHFDYSAQHSDYRIVTLEGRVSAQAFHLGQLPLRIGRDPQNEVVLDDVNSSRFHAEIRDQDGQLVVVDLGSTNGLKVNGELVTERALNQHDVIQIGDCLFEFLPPGVLSKGVPQAAVFSNGSDAVTPVPKVKKKKRLLWLAAGVIVLVAGYFVLMSGGEKAAEAVKQMAAEQAKEELSSIRAELEKKMQKPVGEINPEEVKEAFLSHIKDSSLMKFLPPEAQAQMSQLPPEVLQIFVQDPDLLSEVINQGADQRAVAMVLKRRIGDFVVQKRHIDALALAEILLKLTPEDAGLKEAKDRLQVLVAAKSKDASGYTEAEKKFYEYMEQHENFVMQLMDEKKFDEALKFTDVVSKNIGVLMAQDKNFERVGLEEKEKWDQRARDLREKIEERDAKAKDANKIQAEGDLMVAQIKEHLNFGEVGKANALIARFVDEFPNHPDRNEVASLKAQLEASVDRSFESTRTAIEQLVETEAYENAWKELYRFLDLMPQNERAKALRDLIEKKTGAKAVQYYNQARVYEFEADDLVAAEQYYKRTLEIADPRSDLAKKAGRRMAEVKRRTIQ